MLTRFYSFFSSYDVIGNFLFTHLIVSIYLRSSYNNSYLVSHGKYLIISKQKSPRKIIYLLEQSKSFLCNFIRWFNVQVVEPIYFSPVMLHTI